MPIALLHADLVVVGGGMAGTCCAITAARAGAKVVLVQDRPVLGGNASSEVRLYVCGATYLGHGNNRWSREGGVIDEILVENTFRNPEGNPVIFDTILLEKVVDEPNITLLLNTIVHGVNKEGSRILSVEAFCSQNQMQYQISAPLFCDSSGDGILATLAGAAFRMGAEAADEFGEGFAPSEEYGALLGHSIYFYTKDVGRPVKFLAPSFALDDVTTISQHRSFSTSENGCQLWWIEYGGRLDTVHDTEEIKWELWKVVYGVWNHLKNSGKFPEAENLTLEWVGLIPGKRESRRFEGHYMLRQKDIVEQVEHEDAVAFGGHPIDLHPADGVFSEHPGAKLIFPPGIFQIPYRCLISRSVSNLFLAGRLISASHVAFAATRVMATCAHGGQAVGMAAALCARDGLEPVELLSVPRIGELRRELLKTGQHVPGVPLRDSQDLATYARVAASSEYVLSELPGDGPALRLDASRAQLLPLPAGRLPQVGFTLNVDAQTTLRVEARISDRVDNHTPSEVLGVCELRLAAGADQHVKVDIEASIDKDRYVFFCLMENEHVAVVSSETRLTGMTAAFHEHTQKFDEAIGSPYIELWCPEKQPHGRNLAVTVNPPLRPFSAANICNGFARPTSQPNAWLSASDDEDPTLTLSWAGSQRIGSVDLRFDTDFDRPMLTVLVEQDERAIPHCVRHYRLRADDRVVAEVTDNHQTRAVHVFDPPLEATEMAVDILATNGAGPGAIFEFHCYE
ncbi:FAD-dependent oxidoreductase [Amycolatopsis acidiphila]|uniref:FAD-dependent oxidoreductase n=1 Tax=Amycolatopsis acidiphila TaxID=715473 RepID=UPI001C93B077|nr:FAD-dependent oxidoreductase [Amycolatopsis acidiphila]UIJ58137.1 FAD-dependent oxidoreductase [Amycolatopsis acidiphila]